MVHRETPYKRQGLKHFDLVAGDLVRDTEEKITYKILRIYPHIFTCRDFNKNTTSFPKVDYLTGRITRVVKDK